MKINIKDKIISRIPEENRPKIAKTFNVLRIIKNIVCWTSIAIMVFFVITFLLNRISGVTPAIMGYTIQRVTSGSMEPELAVGDVIISKQVDDVSVLVVDDIITFDGGSQYEHRNVTHRVVTAPYEDNGRIYLQTKGDANEIPDNPIYASQVQSKMIRKAPFLTVLYNFFLSPWGLIVFILLLLLIFFDELINIVKITSGYYDSEEKEESISEIIERIQREDNEKEEQLTVAESAIELQPLEYDNDDAIVVTDETMGNNKSMYERIYDAVLRIPRGKVATYGQVAALAGNGGAARVVGNALHVNPAPGVIPCHRVVNAKGRLAPGFAFGGSDAQKKLLESEGVEVIDDHVDLKIYQMKQSGGYYG